MPPEADDTDRASAYLAGSVPASTSKEPLSDMPITIGDAVPSIQAPTYLRGRANAPLMGPADHRGRWVVLVFYPRDFTFVCPTELAELADLAPAFMDEDAVVMAVSTDSWFTHRRWFEDEPRLAGVGYPVVADTAHELARAFGVLEEDGTCRRGTFVIDPEGVVRHSTISDGSVGRSAAETLRVLCALRTGELCPASWQPGQPTLIAA
jgi:alkyl hydroperoxide reductase subunit AhpC